MFIVDESSSINADAPTNLWPVVRDFLNNIVFSLQVSADLTRVGLVMFNNECALLLQSLTHLILLRRFYYVTNGFFLCSSRLIFDFDDYFMKENILDVINRIECECDQNRKYMS